jgi:protein involved in polysaccharide export with SLBB domain
MSRMRASAGLIALMVVAQASSARTQAGSAVGLAGDVGTRDYFESTEQFFDEFGDPIDDGARQRHPSSGAFGHSGTIVNERARRPTNVRQVRKLRPLEPNGFQRFVQQSTGRLLPLHGVAVFDQAVEFGPPLSAVAPADYPIGPGDEVLVQVTGFTELRLRLVVDSTGRITIPKVGPVSVAGVKASELEAHLDKALRRTFKTFTLSASLGAIRPIDVYLVGQARVPGRHTVAAVSSFVTAVLSTGGPGAGGSFRHVELVREGKVIATLDLYAFLATGRSDGDPRLAPGDTIVFPPAGPRVALLGDIQAPAIYELADRDEPLGALLQLIGGVPVTSRRQATVERIDPRQASPRRVESLTLDEPGLASPLHDGDIITFLPLSPAFDNAVTLRGNVALPMRHPFVAGMRVKDLIPDREALINPDYYRKKNVLVQFDDTSAPGALPQQAATAESTRHNVKDMLEEVNWEYAVVERLDRQSLTTRLLPFHLGKAVLEDDASQNLALEAGDVVTIFSVKDLAVPQARRTRLVRIEGEVKAPGIYQLEAGETLPRLLERVGGTTAQAYLFGLALRRERVRKAQQETVNDVVKQLEAELRSHIAWRQSNLPTSGDPGQMAAFQAQLQFEERFAMDRIARIKAAKPEGRISLELQPDKPVIPDVVLEDGDAIVVPATPSFVTVVGAVLNENGLVWKEGRTVGEYLALAGTAPTADLDNIYVLRADGSVRSRDRGFFSWWPAQNHGLVLQPGDVVIVPERMDLEGPYTVLVRGLKDWTQILANMGIAVASVTLLFR